MPQLKVLRADLALAGIPYQTSDGFADFHSLRVSAATAYARVGMSLRSRQAAMRHTDSRLTDTVYTDERLLPVA
ncbi:MAG: hypothetical protein ED559_09040 [Phycisphaera sp.]|nr:MAG: hypothetical protein ED559_09040 [Phycisphaera sp.]